VLKVPKHHQVDDRRSEVPFRAIFGIFTNPVEALSTAPVAGRQNDDIQMSVIFPRPPPFIARVLSRTRACNARVVSLQ